MKDDESLNIVRSAIWQSEQNAPKTLIILNSGATVVGFGFAGQSWKEFPEFQLFVVVAIFLFFIGAVCASINVVFFVKKYIEWHYRSAESGRVVLDKRKKYGILYDGLNVIGLCLFFLGNLSVWIGLIVNMGREVV